MQKPDEAGAGWRGTVRAGWTSFRAWPWRDTWQVLRQRFREDRLGMTAGSLTFTTLIALVPLLTVALAVFTAFPMFSAFQESLQKYFLQSLVPDAIAKPVLGSLTQFAKKANRLGVMGIIVLVVSAVSLMLTIDRALNSIWRVRRPRPIGQRVLIYWSAVTLGPLVLGLSLSLTSYALSASRGLVSALPGGVAFALDVLEFALLCGFASALFHFVPNTQVRWRHALAGGLFVGVGLELAKRGLGWYVGSVSGLSTIYGAFATVPIFLLWLYLVWSIVLLGAVVAAYAPTLQFQLARWRPMPGQAFTLALGVLGLLHRARQQGRGGLDLLGLGAGLAVDPLQLEPVLDRLVRADWVARLDEDGEQRHVLLIDPAQRPAAALMELLLLQPHPANARFLAQMGLGALTLAQILPNAEA
ncbi:YihY family inner membrane protein [Ideonella sp. TBM-1]|uniref:UPF0761 membrane protein G3A44_09585 n=2 Tax=Ideonella livida TaxID=2707176 RepID=A0A7C9TIP3_9BURK|nr:YihY family inner membrane protein [Ideonella livida]